MIEDKDIMKAHVIYSKLTYPCMSGINEYFRQEGLK
jgi:hypothetical protein